MDFKTGWVFIWILCLAASEVVSEPTKTVKFVNKHEDDDSKTDDYGFERAAMLLATSESEILNPNFNTSFRVDENNDSSSYKPKNSSKKKREIYYVNPNKDSKSWGSSSQRRPRQQCDPGTSWQKNCRECYCNQAGLPICRLIHGCYLKPSGLPLTCKPYTWFRIDHCNICECNGDGVPICSFIDCFKPVAVPREENIAQRFFGDKISHYTNNSEFKCHDYPRCAPFTTWISSCYRCYCDHKGKNNCVKIPNCQVSKEVETGSSKCKPNSAFQTKCTKCRCDDDGQLSCYSTC